MGLSSNHTSTGIGKYVNFSKGKLMGYVDGEKKAFTEITGRIVNLDIEDAKYDAQEGQEAREYKKVVLYITDLDNEFQLGFDLISGYGQAFCKISPNINFGADVEISGSYEPKGLKGKASLYVKQANKAGKWENLKWFWTKDKPGKLPPPTEGKDRKGTYLDFSKQNEFFLDMLIKKIRPAILKANPEGDAVKNRVKEKDGEVGNDSADGLPF